MAWQIDFDENAEKELASLDHSAQRAIRSYLRHRIAPAKDPRDFGKALRHELIGVWAYRVGSYRILAHIEDRSITVLVIGVGHRKDVYGRA